VASGVQRHTAARCHPLLKPVPITPIIGTTLPIVPLDSVNTWFHISEKFPGYRNHFSKVAAFHFPVPMARVETKTRETMHQPMRATLLLWTQTIDTLVLGVGGLILIVWGYTP
jgi:hypothetical protein